ncbi:uncharacterized protein METZ01_LOCUS388456, partial [marine metagenome]
MAISAAALCLVGHSAYLLSDACRKTGLHERPEQAKAAFRRLS